MVVSTTHQHDVVIIGGGLVGASLGCALADVNVDCALVETTPLGVDEQPSYDERTVALTYSSRQIFAGIGVWEQIAAKQATPITAIHVSDKGHFGHSLLSCEDAGTDALGFVVPHRVLGEVFYQQIESRSAITQYCPGTADTIEPSASNSSEQDSSQCATVTLADGRKLQAKLVVIADGGRSGLAESLGMRGRGRDYSQQAVVATLTSDKDPDGLAFERFTSSGPLALLPAGDGRYVMAWTLEPDDVDAMVNGSDDFFLSTLQQTIGRRAGRFIETSARRAYPLRLHQLTSPVSQRTVAIGNAAHTVHPVAGQGFNLGLRDVAALADVLFDAARNGRDLGDRTLLNAYAKGRKSDTRSVGWITDGLIRAFANDSIPLAVARNTGLSAINLLPPVRRALLRQTMGLNASTSTLALGLPLGSAVRPEP